MKTPPKDEKVQMNLTIEREIRRALKRQSAETDRPMGDIVNDLLRKGLCIDSKAKQTA